MPSATTPQRPPVLAVLPADGRGWRVPLGDVSPAGITQAAKALAAQMKQGQRGRPSTASSEARALAAKAAGLSAVRSAIIPKDAQVFLDEFETKREGQHITVRHGGQEITFSTRDLRAFAIKGANKPAVSAGITSLAAGTRLWGRKLALLVLASIR